MDENFRKEFREIQNQARLGVNAYYFSHMEELTDSYREAMAGACRQVKAIQDKGYQDVEFMEITMLRTRLLEQDSGAYSGLRAKMVRGSLSGPGRGD